MSPIRYCDNCGHRRAERSTEELPDVVKQDMGRVCADCYAEMREQAELLGLTV